MTCCWLTGDPIANIKLLEDPGKNLVVIMKDGKVFKKHRQCGKHQPEGQNRNQGRGRQQPLSKLGYASPPLMLP